MNAMFEHFDLSMTLSDAKSASHAGNCEYDVRALLDKPAIKRQLAKIPDDALADELRDYGAWDDEELLSRDDNELRVVWLAACNIAEESKREA